MRKEKHKGKEKITRIFQKLEKGQRVGIVRDLSEKSSFPARIQGRTGIIEGRRGKAYIVKIINGKEKSYIIKPVHLKKLK